MTQRDLSTLTLILAPIILSLSVLLIWIWGNWATALPLIFVALITAVQAMKARKKINHG